MKTTTMMMMAAAAMLATACSNDERGAADNSPVELRLTSGVEVNESRANTQDKQLLEGQWMLAWVDDANGTPLYAPNWYLADGNGGFRDFDNVNFGGGITTPNLTQSMYFPQTGNNVNIYAIAGKSAVSLAWYNANAEITDLADVTYQFAWPSEIDLGIEGEIEDDLLYAVERGVARNKRPTTQNLTFYHMLSKLEIAVVSGAGTPELADDLPISISDAISSAIFKPSKNVDMTDADARGAMIESAGASTIYMDAVTCSDFDTNIVYNETIVVPQDMSKKVIEFKLKDRGILKYTIPEGTVFKSGMKYRYQVTLNLTGLQVSSSIEPWGDTTPQGGSAEMDNAN